MDSRTMQLQVKKIRLDGDTQPRVEMDEGLIADYAENYRKKIVMPDPVVFYDGKDYWLASGFHRVYAMLQAKIRWSSFIVFDGTARDAFLYAAGTNDRHGLRRRPEDVRKCIRRMLQDEEWGHWSFKDISRRCKCDPRTVSDEKRQIWREAHPHYDTCTSENGTTKRKYRTKHGTTATMETAKIGKAAYRPRPIYAKDRPHLREQAEKQLKRTPMKLARQALTAGWTWEQTVAALRRAWDSIPVVEGV